jgi:hypothetical protein
MFANSGLFGHQFSQCNAWTSAKAGSQDLGLWAATDNAGIGPESTSRGARHLADRVIEWISPDENPAGVVYGTVIIGAVLATESTGHETLLETFVAIVLALALYWLAHAYAHTLGERLDRQTPLRGAGILSSLLHDLAIVRGASLPVLALLISSACGASLATAVLVALWTSALAVVSFELVAGIRAGLRGAELLVQVCVGAVMGLAIIALRAVLH